MELFSFCLLYCYCCFCCYRCLLCMLPPYYIKFSRHVYLATVRCAYFAILRKFRILNFFNLAFSSNTQFFSVAMLLKHVPEFSKPTSITSKLTKTQRLDYMKTVTKCESLNFRVMLCSRHVLFTSL